MDWLERAACGGADTRWFENPVPSWAGTGEALRLCAGCPVTALCAERMSWSGDGNSIGFDGVAAGMLWRNGRPHPRLTQAARRRWLGTAA